MKQELEAKLVARWPEWFRVNGDIQQTLMPLGFQHGDGWFPILFKLCDELEPLVVDWERNSGRSFVVLEVKEKFGSLRFYANADDDLIQQRIEAATLESLSICEVCGRPGRLRQEGHISTLCDSCAQQPPE